VTLLHVPGVHMCLICTGGEEMMVDEKMRWSLDMHSFCDVFFIVSFRLVFQNPRL